MTEPVKGKIQNAKVDFYLQARMISTFEAQQCLKGNMAIVKASQRTALVNLNVSHKDHPTLLTGETAVLYENRADDIHADLLCGLKPRERGNEKLASQQG